MDTDKFMKYVEIVRQWFKDEEIDLGYPIHDLVLGRMASRLNKEISKAQQRAVEQCIEKLDIYFLGLVHIPDPQATLEKIKDQLKSELAREGSE